MAATATLYQQPLQNNVQNGFIDQAAYDPQYLTGVFCKALYDYQSADTSSLSFRRGDIIEVLTQLDSGWWDGLLNEERGWFPSNYVAIMSEQELEQEELFRAVRADPQEHGWSQDLGDDQNGPSNDFWVPRVNSDGRIFFLNTQTGERSNELPGEVDSDHEPLMNAAVSMTNSSSTTLATYTPTSGAPTTVVGDSPAGFGLPRRTGTPEPWVKRLHDDGLTYYYVNTVDGTKRWTAPSPPLGYQPQDAFSFPDGRPRAESAAGRAAERASVYSDDSDVNPLGILGKAAVEAGLLGSQHNGDAQGLSPKEPDDPPEVVAAKELQASLENRFALTPDSLNDLADASRAAISDLVDIALARNNTYLIKDAIKRTTDSVRNLIYASSALITPLVNLPQPYASTSGFNDTADLKTFHRKVTASMVKLVTAIRASLGSDLVSNDMSTRFETDAAELGRAITAFVQEVLKKRPPGDSARLVRAVLHSEEGRCGIGLDIFGAGAASYWKGFGFVGSINGKQLNPGIVRNVQAHKDHVDDTLMALESAISTSEVPDVIQSGQQAIQSLVIFLGLVADVNIASVLDLDSEDMDASYIQSVNRAREVVRSMEFSVQAAFEDGAVLLNMIQSVTAPSPVWKVLASAIPTLRDNISDVSSQISELTRIAQSQADACAKAGVTAQIGTRAMVQPTRSDRDTIVYYSVGDMMDNMLESRLSTEEDIVNFGDVLHGSVGDRDQPRHINANIYGTVGRNDSNTSLGRAPIIPLNNGFGGKAPSARSDASPINVTTSLPPPNDGVLAESAGDDDDILEGLEPNRPRVFKSGEKLVKLLGEDAPEPYIRQIEEKAGARPPYLRPEYSGNEHIWLTPEGVVRGGTIPALIERLTMHDSRDNVFISTFLLTFRSFTTLDEVFDCLVKRFYIEPPAGLEPDQLKEWLEKKQQVVRFRVINIMRQIVTDENVLEKEDAYILDRIKDFAATVEKEVTPPIPAAKQLIELVIRAQNGGDAMIKRTQVVPQFPPASILPKSMKGLKLLDIEPLELARQLTIMESKLFTKIRPMECLNRGRDVKAADTEDNISAIIDTSNKVAEWVADAILSRDDAKKRAAVIKQFIAVADRCRLLQNFSTMAALVAGLNSPPIRRLKRTWEQVNQRSKAQLQEAERTMDTNKNFTNYRAILKRAQLPCVPFFGVYLTVLTFIQDGNKNMIRGDLINFGKREKFAEVVREIQHYQSKPYNLAPIPGIQSFIEEQLAALGNSTDVSDRAWNLSLEREPREREDEKMARLLQESGFI